MAAGDISSERPRSGISRKGATLLYRLLTQPSIRRWGAPLRTLRQICGRQPRRLPLTEARAILVIRPDEIGDVVLTGPFLRELRRAAAPEARITLMVASACYNLVEHCPYVDAVHSFPFSGGWRVVAAAWQLRWKVIRQGFDLVLLPRYDKDWYQSILAAHLLAGRGAILLQRPEALVRFSVAPPVLVETFPNSQIGHEVIQSLRFLQCCGATDIRDSFLELWLTTADRDFARSWLKRHLTRRAPLIVLHPSGGRSPLKQWPIERFRALLKRLDAETFFDFLIIGGKDESWVTSQFAGETCERVVLSVGELTLRQLGAVLEHAMLFVGGDSGPMHLAAAAGTNVIGVFGPTSEVRFRPWGSHCTVVSQRYSCSPDVLGTFEDRCSTCQFSEPRCLTELSVEAVFSAARRVLASGCDLENGPSSDALSRTR